MTLLLLPLLLMFVLTIQLTPMYAIAYSKQQQRVLLVTLVPYRRHVSNQSP